MAESQFDIQGFFDQVTRAVIQTQRQLDDESEKYSKDAAGKPFARPTTFQLPKLNANISFALSGSTQDGIKLLFYSKGSEATESQKQHINFEITAAPTPPELTAQLPSLALNLRFLSSKKERDDVRAVVERAGGATAETVKDNWKHILIIRNAMADFTLLGVFENGSIWSLAPDANGDPKLTRKAAMSAAHREILDPIVKRQVVLFPNG